MNTKALSIRMKENYGEILTKMSVEEKAWAEKFETLEYAIERGREDTALSIYKELKGSSPTKEQRDAVKLDATLKERGNPTFVAAQERYEQENKAKRRKTDEHRNTANIYDPSDFIDQRFNSAGYELAVSLSPEDAIVDALDAARAANVSLEDLLFGNVVITKQRGRGRPKKGAN